MMYPDSTNSSENSKLNSSMDNPIIKIEHEEEGASNIFNVPSYLDVSEELCAPPDISYYECGKCKALQLELDRNKKISNCMKQKLISSEQIFKSCKEKEILCEELKVMTQNLEKIQCELKAKNMELERTCSSLENKLSECLQEQLRFHQNVDSMNVELNSSRKENEQLQAKNEQLQKELIQYKSLSSQRQTVEEDLVTLQKNVTKKEKKLLKIQHLCDKSSTVVLEKEAQIKKMRSSFKTLLKVFVKFGTKLVGAQLATKREKKLLQTYVDKLNQSSSDDTILWQDNCEEKIADLDSSPEKQSTSRLSENFNSETEEYQYQGSDVEGISTNETANLLGKELFFSNGSGIKTDFGISDNVHFSNGENISHFQPQSFGHLENVTIDNNLSESFLMSPIEDSLFLSSSQIKVDPDIASVEEKSTFSIISETSTSDVNHKESGNGIMQNSNGSMRSLSKFNGVENCGLPSSSNIRTNVSQNFLFKKYLKHPFAECQGNGNLPVCDDGLDISIGELDCLKQQVCMKTEQFAPLSPLPPTPPPNSQSHQKRPERNPAIRKALNLEEHQSCSRTAERVSIPGSSTNAYFNSPITETCFVDREEQRNVPFNPSPPKLYSLKKHILCHQQSEGFEVQKDSTLQQPENSFSMPGNPFNARYDNLDNLQSPAASVSKRPHKLSAKRCQDGSIKLDMDFQNNSSGTTKFEIDVESGQMSFTFCPGEPESVRAKQPSTFSPVVISKPSTPVGSANRQDAFHTPNSVISEVYDMNLQANIPQGANVLQDHYQNSAKILQRNAVSEIQVSEQTLEPVHTSPNKKFKKSPSSEKEYLSSPKSRVSSSASNSPTAIRKSSTQHSSNLIVPPSESPKKVRQRRVKKQMNSTVIEDQSLSSFQEMQTIIDPQRLQNSNISITTVPNATDVGEKNQNNPNNASLNSTTKSPDRVKRFLDISASPRKTKLLKSNITPKASRKSGKKKFKSVSFVKSDSDQDSDPNENCSASGEHENDPEAERSTFVGDHQYHVNESKPRRKSIRGKKGKIEPITKGASVRSPPKTSNDSGRTRKARIAKVSKKKAVEPFWGQSDAEKPIVHEQVSSEPKAKEYNSGSQIIKTEQKNLIQNDLIHPDHSMEEKLEPIKNTTSAENLANASNHNERTRKIKAPKVSTKVAKTEVKTSPLKSPEKKPYKESTPPQTKNSDHKAQQKELQEREMIKLKEDNFIQVSSFAQEVISPASPEAVKDEPKEVVVEIHRVVPLLHEESEVDHIPKHLPGESVSETETKDSIACNPSVVAEHTKSHVGIIVEDCNGQIHPLEDINSFEPKDKNKHGSQNVDHNAQENNNDRPGTCTKKKSVDYSSEDDMLVIAEDSTSDVNEHKYPQPVNGTEAHKFMNGGEKSNSTVVVEDDVSSAKPATKPKRKKTKGKPKKLSVKKQVISPSGIEMALEIMDKLKFNDLHYKKYTHNLCCTLVNPMHASSPNEVLLPIITHLASSKRNPMIPYMTSKDQGELLPLIESCIVTCLMEVESKKKPHLTGLLKTTVNALTSTIVTKKMNTVYGVAALCRVLCCLCKNKNDRKTPFVLCCTLLKIHHEFAPYLIASLAGVWPEILQKQDFSNGQERLLMRVFSYALFKKPKQLTETLWKQCTSVLKEVCNISKIASMDLTDTTREIVDFIQAKKFGDNYVEEEIECTTPLVILSVSEGWEWFESNLLPFLKSMITALMHQSAKESHLKLSLICNMFVDISYCVEKENNEPQVFWSSITSEIFTKSSDLPFPVQESLICALMRLYIMKAIPLTKTLSEWVSKHQKQICEHNIKRVYKINNWITSSQVNSIRIEDFNLDKLL